MSKEMCEKCKEHFHRDYMRTIHVKTRSDESCFLCPTCYENWEKIYLKWKKTTYDDFWNKGWNEYLHGKIKRKFNPSLRDKYENSNCV